MGAQWKAKHKMDAANAKGRIFTKLAKEIAVAARNGADPDMNAKLRSAIEAAKKASMPKDTLERAVKKVQACLTARPTMKQSSMKALHLIRSRSLLSV